MNLRTTFKIEPSPGKINYQTPVMFTGSCFASEIGVKMAEGKMTVLVNPTGTVYNPLSIGNTIKLVTDNRTISTKDLYFNNNQYVSFLHYTDYTSDNPESAINKINMSTHLAHRFLKTASFLFVTFGTSRIYRLKTTGEVVSNCHKLPPEMFTQEMLSSAEVVSTWLDLLDRLHSFNNNLQVIFTISPVRHWKDGAHGNQLSKSILFLASEQLLNHPAVAGYFPAYELLMDDLRDYRYYADDMLHPSGVAIDYIWNAFTESYFDPQALALWKEARNIRRAMKHRLSDSSASSGKEFASSMLARISEFILKNPDIDFSSEIGYFTDLETGK